MLISDSFFCGGSSRHVCNDYSISGSYNIRGSIYHYSIVSDGCDQLKDTDFGCRILSVTAKQVMSEIYCEEYIDKTDPEDTFEKIGLKIINRSIGSAKSLGLSTDSLMATLLIAIQKQGSSKVYTVAFGDGFVFGVKDRNVILRKINYELDSPFYWIYATNPMAEKTYFEKFGGKKKIEILNFNLDSSFQKKINPSIDIEHSMAVSVFEFNDFDCVGVSSKGLGNILESSMVRQKEFIWCEKIFKEILKIENFNENFVFSHLDSLIKGQWQGRELFDDISIGMITNVGNEKIDYER